MDDGHPALRIIIFIILLLLNAMFSGLTVAVSSLSAAELERKNEEGNRKAKQIFRIVKEPACFLSTSDLIRVIVALIAGIFIADPYFGKLTDLLQSKMHMAYYPAAVISHLAVGIILVYLITTVSILFPKRIAYKCAEAFSYTLIGPVSFITSLFKPLVYLINRSVNGLVRLCGINPKDIEENVTEEEIIMMVSEGHEQGVIAASEAEMISNIFEFDDKEVSDIMIHRRNICSIDAALPVREALEIMAKERYSRYPVYEDDEDNIIGIVHMKDVVRLILKDENSQATVKSVMRAPHFVPDTQNINALFKDMQAKKVHMAIVVDEYGQSCGLVAMEDILEEIVGNIMDEYDADEENIQAAGGGYLMKGMTPLDDVCELLGITIEDDFDTLNGFLISRLERIPGQGEQVDVEAEGYNFRIMSVKDNAVSQVKVTKIIT